MEYWVSFSINLQESGDKDKVLNYKKKHGRRSYKEENQLALRKEKCVNYLHKRWLDKNSTEKENKFKEDEANLKIISNEFENVLEN